MNKTIQCMKGVAFFVSLTCFGFGMFPETRSQPYGAFAFAFLSLAVIIAWNEVKSLIRR